MTTATKHLIMLMPSGLEKARILENGSGIECVIPEGKKEILVTMGPSTAIERESLTYEHPKLIFSTGVNIGYINVETSLMNGLRVNELNAEGTAFRWVPLPNVAPSYGDTPGSSESSGSVCFGSGAKEVSSPRELINAFWTQPFNTYGRYSREVMLSSLRHKFEDSGRKAVLQFYRGYMINSTGDTWWPLKSNVKWAKPDGILLTCDPKVVAAAKEINWTIPIRQVYSNKMTPIQAELVFSLANKVKGGWECSQQDNPKTLFLSNDEVCHRRSSSQLASSLY